MLTHAPTERIQHGDFIKFHGKSPLFERVFFVIESDCKLYLGTLEDPHLRMPADLVICSADSGKRLVSTGRDSNPQDYIESFARLLYESTNTKNINLIFQKAENLIFQKAEIYGIEDLTKSDNLKDIHQSNKLPFFNIQYGINYESKFEAYAFNLNPSWFSCQDDLMTNSQTQRYFNMLKNEGFYLSSELKIAFKVYGQLPIDYLFQQGDCVFEPPFVNPDFRAVGNSSRPYFEFSICQDKNHLTLEELQKTIHTKIIELHEFRFPCEYIEC